MKPKETFDTFIFRERSSAHATKIIDFDGKKFKITYRNGNAFEEFTVELFDGAKLNHVCGMKDLGITPNTSAYLLNTEVQTGARISQLTKLAIEFIYKLLY